MRRRDFLRAAACWTKCSAFTQSQEPREQQKGPFALHTFCTRRYTSSHKVNEQGTVRLLTDQSFRQPCVRVHAGLTLHVHTKGQATPAHVHTNCLNVCFLHYALSSFNLLLVQCSEEIMIFPAATLVLVLAVGTLLGQNLFVESGNGVGIE